MPGRHPIHLARDLADRHCEGCAWYHGSWPTWRALGLGSSPAVHAGFYRHAVAQGAWPHPPRVLVTGAADEGMAAVILDAFGAIGLVPALTVLDVCETPLALVRAWALDRGVEVATVCADAREAPAGAFDLVCTHSFLGHFDREERHALAWAWRGALRPGGRLLTVNRLRPDAPDGRIGFTPAQADAWVASVVRAAAGRPELGSPEALAALARRYADHYDTWPLHGASELVATLQGAGFAVDLRTEAVPASGTGHRGGPGTRGGAEYALVVATAQSSA